MIAVIDTNLFYYLCNNSNNKYDSTQLLSNLKKDYENVEISDLTILEVLVAFRFKKQELIKKLDFIKNSNFTINTLFLPEHKFNGNYIINNYQDSILLDKILKHAYELKKDIENSYLRFWTCSLASIIVACKCFSNTTQVKHPNYKYDLCAIMLNNNNKDGQLGLYFNDVLNDFYESKDPYTKRQRKLRELIINKIFEFAESLYGFTEVEKKGIDFKKIYNEDDNFTEEEWNDINESFSDSTICNLENRKKGFEKSFNESEQKKLHENLIHFETTLASSNKMPKGQCTYFRILFEAILLSNNQKLEKNDIIDSMFMIYYPSKQIITVDKGLQDKIQLIDNNYYNNIIYFLNKCLKD